MVQFLAVVAWIAAFAWMTEELVIGKHLLKLAFLIILTLLAAYFISRDQ